MTLDISKEKGVPLSEQRFTWRDMVPPPMSKLNDDAFTRLRVLLMGAVEAESHRFSHSCARMNRVLQAPLAQLRRVEQYQQTMIQNLLSPDASPLETTIAFEQVGIEIAAMAAQQEPDPYLAQVYRFGMLEDFDHMYRYAALLDRIEGKDANNVLQSYTDICPGRSTEVQHRAPEDDLKTPYDRICAHPVSKLNALTVTAAEHQTREYYINVGPLFSDPVARQLYAEIGSVEEQHVTQYESLMDTQETWLEKWVLHEAAEVYNYYSCLTHESHSQIKLIWERFLAFELGHLHMVSELFQQYEKRDVREILPATLPPPLDFKHQRDFVRQTLENEVGLRAAGTRFIQAAEEATATPQSLAYRRALNADGMPSQIVAAGYIWRPGTELTPHPASPMTQQRQEAHVS